MPVTVVVFSDTHCREWTDVHCEIRRAVAGADIAVHCGDFTHMAVLDGLKCTASTSVVVHGNSDSVEIRKSIPYVETFDVEGHRIGVIHPAWGGPPFDMRELLDDFPQPVDVVLFGHTHDPVNEMYDGTLFINPGQAYTSFMVSTTIAVLTISEGAISAEIQVIESHK